jgi:hypothetical protein
MFASSGACTDTLVRPSQQCAGCDEKLAKKNAVVEIRREGQCQFNIYFIPSHTDTSNAIGLNRCVTPLEGTGFASGGMAEATKFELAFQ